MKMETIFQRRAPAAGRSRRASGRAPAAGTGGRRLRRGTCQRPGTSGGHQRPEIAPGNVPAAGRSRRASGGHQRREGRDVPAADTSGGHQRPEIAPGNVPAAGRSRRASGRAPAAGTSGRRLRRGTCQRREGRDVPAPGTSGGHQRPEIAPGNVPAAGRSRRASAGHQRRPIILYALFPVSRNMTGAPLLSTYPP